MNFEVDIKTIVFALILGNVFFLIMVLAYNHNKGHNRIINLFIQSKIFQIIGWSIFLLRDYIVGIQLVILPNLLLLIGGSLESIAILNLDGIKFSQVVRYYAILFTITFVSLVSTVLLSPSISLRIALISIFFAIIFAYPAWRLLCSAKDSVLKKTWGHLYALVVFALLIRAYSAIFINRGMVLFDNTIGNIITYIILFIHMVVFNGGFILLSKEKDDQRLYIAATKDEMTDIFNRRTFSENAEIIIMNAAKNNIPLSFFMIDIDNFKVINDTFGHIVGDAVLKEFSSLLSSSLQNEDLVGRFGGDEIAILLYNVNSAQAQERAKQLLETIKNHQYCSCNNYCITVSIGISTILPNATTHLDDFYRLSDEALYEAKSLGKNRIVKRDTTIKSHTLFDESNAP